MLALGKTVFYIRGSKNRMPVWLGRTYAAILGGLLIVGAFLVVFGPFPR